MHTANRVISIVTSALVIFATLLRTVGIKRDARIAGIKPKLTDMLIRDGTS